MLCWFIAEEFQTSKLGINISMKTVFWELRGMGFHCQANASLTSLSTTSSIRWSGIKHRWTLEQWKPVLWSETGFGGCQEKDTCQTKKFGGGGIIVGLLFRDWARPNFNASAYQDKCYVSKFWGRPFSIPIWQCTSPQSKVHKNMVGWVWWKNLTGLHRALTLTPSNTPWRLWARSSLTSQILYWQN